MVESPVSPSSSIPAPLLSEASVGLGSKTKVSKVGTKHLKLDIDGEVKRRNIEDKSHWKPDKNADSCFICNSSFGMYVRKHHCRKCGEIICDSCSEYVEATKDDFVFETRQGSLRGKKVRFCVECRKNKDSTVMAKSYSKTKHNGLLGLGVKNAIFTSSNNMTERQSNADGIPYDDTKAMVKSIMETPVMAFFNRDTRGNLPPMYVGHLKIIVKSAQNLPPADLNGKADPYVKIYLKGKTSRDEDWDPEILTPKPNDKGKTSIKNCTLFPVWNEQINFRIPRADAYVDIQVWDHDRFSQNEIMASTKIELEDIIAESAYAGGSIGDALHKTYTLKSSKDKNKDAGTIDLSIEFHYNLWGYLLSRYWPEQDPKNNDPDFSPNITIQNIQNLLSELQPYIDFVVDFVGLMSWNNGARSAGWLAILLYVTYYPRFMFPLINILLLRKMYYHYKCRLERIVSIKQNKCTKKSPKKSCDKQKRRKMFNKRLFFSSDKQGNADEDKEKDDENNDEKIMDGNPQDDSLVETKEKDNTEILLAQEAGNGQQKNAVGIGLNWLISRFGTTTLKSIQNYIGLVVHIMRIIRHLWDWDSPVLTTVMAVIMSLSLLFHSTILNFKYTWMTLIIFLFIVLTPIWDYGLWGILRTIPNIGTYLKVKNKEKAKEIMEKADRYRKSRELYREETENEFDEEEDLGATELVSPVTNKKAN